MKNPPFSVLRGLVALGIVVAVVLASWLGSAAGGVPSRPATPSKPSGFGGPPKVPPAPPKAKPGSPLPTKSGSVKVDTSLQIGVPGASSPSTSPQQGTSPQQNLSPAPSSPTSPTSPTSPSSPTSPTSSSAAGTAAATTTGTTGDATFTGTATAQAAAATTYTKKVALRALVLTVDAGDYGLPTWKMTLDRLGAAYDVIETKSTDITQSTLVKPDGTGRYNAILLTDGMQLYPDGSGGYTSGLSDAEWNLLWAYERDYGVRQATLYSSYGTWPEDYCLRAGSEGGVGDTPLTAGLTSTGASTLNYLKASARIPITQSYVYRDTLAAGCNGQAILQSGSDVLGVKSTSADGRERMALTFTSNQYLLQADLLVYGLFRWATHGMYLGEQRHYLNVDVDDWFNTSDERLPDGTINSDPGWAMTAHDAYNASTQQANLRKTYPLASQFKMNLSYNGGDANLNAGSKCSPNGGTDQLTATSKCLKGQFEWINHTLTHPKMNFTDYATNFTEINQNLSVAKTLGLSVPKQVLKTPEYSGLGTYNPDPNDDVDPPTDYGLGASNPYLLQAAKDSGVLYLHGNMSFKSQQPACFNCGIIHPMEPSLSIVPDWPTNIAYFSTTPDEETSFYNWYYGPNGKFPYWPTDLTYSQIIDYEAGIALQHLTSGSIYTHTMHIGNLRDYGSGKTLLTDWANAVMSKYSSYYAVPLLTTPWSKLAPYVMDRNKHFDELQAGVEAVYDPAANTITVQSPSAGKITLSGTSAAGSTKYGSDVSAPVTLAANTPVTVPASKLP